MSKLAYNLFPELKLSNRILPKIGPKVSSFSVRAVGRARQFAVGQTDRHTDRERLRGAGRQTDRLTNSKAAREHDTADKQIGRQAGKPASRQTDRQTERQVNNNNQTTSQEQPNNNPTTVLPKAQQQPNNNSTTWLPRAQQQLNNMVV